MRVGAALGIPSFPCVGEGEFWTVQKFGAARARRDLAGAAGFMANSSLLKRMLGEQLGIAPERVGVFPNGVDLSRFHPRAKREARRRCGLPADGFLVACVGNYLRGKGPARVGEAIEGLDGVGGAFAGAGPLPPRGANVVFDRRIPHAQIPEFLSAADVFVLPTLAEGCCNAILEALACGLPVISSTGEFNDDILDDSVSLRVDPLDIGQIRAAIVALRDDPARRARMAEAARRHAERFDINVRAAAVLRFMAQAANGEHGPAWPCL